MIGLMRRHVDVDAPREPAGVLHHRDQGVDLLGRTGDHGLSR